MKKIFSFLLGCWGVFCLLGGFSYITKAPLRGIFLLLEGLVCLPIYTKLIDKTSLSNKKATIIRTAAIVIFLFIGFLNVPTSNTPVAETEPKEEKKIEEVKQEEEPKEEVKKEEEKKAEPKKLDRFAEWRIQDINNNSSSSTWKFCKANEDVNTKDAELLKAYYNKFFKNEDEVHFILTDKTTTKITVANPYLLVSVHERVKGEEGNADNIPAGDLIEEFMVNLDTVEIE